MSRPRFSHAIGKQPANAGARLGGGRGVSGCKLLILLVELTGIETVTY
jgi:hypothetical protein